MNTEQTKFSELASRINSHVDIIRKEGTENDRELFNKMMAYLPELHVLWTNTTDEELVDLFSLFPHFEYYCQVVEELSVEEQAKKSRSYDGLEKFSDKQQEVMRTLLIDSTHIEKIFLDFKVNKQVLHTVAYESLCDDVFKWKKEADEFIRQLEVDNFHEYGIKACGNVIIENYKRLESLIIEIKERFEPLS